MSSAWPSGPETHGNRRQGSVEPLRVELPVRFRELREHRQIPGRAGSRRRDRRALHVVGQNDIPRGLTLRFGARDGKSHDGMQHTFRCVGVSLVHPQRPTDQRDHDGACAHENQRIHAAQSHLLQPGEQHGGARTQRNRRAPGAVRSPAHLRTGGAGVVSSHVTCTTTSSTGTTATTGAGALGTATDAADAALAGDSPRNRSRACEPIERHPVKNDALPRMRKHNAQSTAGHPSLLPVLHVLRSAGGCPSIPRPWRNPQCFALGTLAGWGQRKGGKERRQPSAARENSRRRREGKGGSRVARGFRGTVDRNFLLTCVVVPDTRTRSTSSRNASISSPRCRGRHPDKSGDPCGRPGSPDTRPTGAPTPRGCGDRHHHTRGRPACRPALPAAGDRPRAESRNRRSTHPPWPRHHRGACGGTMHCSARDTRDSDRHPAKNPRERSVPRGCPRRAPCPRRDRRRPARCSTTVRCRPVAPGIVVDTNCCRRPGAR